MIFRLLILVLNSLLPGFYVASAALNGLSYSYGYDAVGNRTVVTYGETNRKITSVYDVLNRLSTMTETARVSSYGYDLNGNIVTKSSGNGDTETTVYDALNRDSNLLTKNSAGTLEYQNIMGYDLMGNVLTNQEIYPGSTIPSRTVTNAYDGVYRIMEENSAAGGTTTFTGYTYDSANNRSTKAVTVNTGTTATTNYNYNNLNQVTSTTGALVASFTYDVDGERTKETQGANNNLYAYDADNRLVTVTDGIGTTGTGTYNYAYDYRTRRTLRDESAASGVATHLVYSGGTSCQEYSTSISTSNLQVEFIRGNDYGGGVGGILYSLRSTVPSYTHANKRGDITAKADSTGSVTYLAQYQAFGDQVATYGTTLDRQKSNSKEQDPWGGHNEGMRYRDDFGFLTRDPAGMIDGPNEYCYVNQNPWTHFDPEGLSRAWNWGGRFDYTGVGTIIHGVFDLGAIPLESAFDFGRWLRSIQDRFDRSNTDAAVQTDSDQQGTREIESIQDTNQNTVQALPGLATFALSVPGTSLTGPVAAPDNLTEATTLNTVARDSSADAGIGTQSQTETKLIQQSQQQQAGFKPTRAVVVQQDYLRLLATRSGGPGQFQLVGEGMSQRAADYQAQITGHAPEIGYVVSGVKFDSYDGSSLIDAKGPGYATFVDKNGSYRSWFDTRDNLLVPAQRQIAAANGTPITWKYAEKAAANATRDYFKQNKININVEEVAPAATPASP